MDKEEISKQVSLLHDRWYYYYDFDGVEVMPSLKRERSTGIRNWNKLKPIIQKLASCLEDPHVFDIGCNMALYAHEMTKMGITVTAIDRNIDTALFYSRYVQENKGDKWQVDLHKMDITTEVPYSDKVNIVTLFCVIYHLHPKEEETIARLKEYFPNHKYVVIQGNTPRIKKRNQPLAGKQAIKALLEKYGYKTKTYDWWFYPKPVVVGERE
ncbi:MAG TPA: class I SAM-dependent methyltransferase [Elusimicrobiota bacterium]|nr:class I SAM-dependent methyltransferase [Elusimicrobiota bacterium]